MIKEWCEECEGTCDYSEWDACDISDDGRDCPTCNGKGYIEREIKAEDEDAFTELRAKLDDIQPTKLQCSFDDGVAWTVKKIREVIK